MLKEFKNHIDQQFPFLKESKLIIAISGGLDSVVLTYLCKFLNFNFVLAHCNFNLRGNESNADEDFVLELGKQLNIKVFVQNCNTHAYAKKYKCSIQMAARELRYNWFNELATQLKLDYILTAHHAGDNLETFLINFIRGTGLNGLTGIPVVNDNMVRPLLQFSRVQIENYAKKNNIMWREDSSNSSRKYLRNKLRHNVVPVLKEINPQLLDSFQNTLANLNDTVSLVKDCLSVFSKKAIVSVKNDSISYKISEFKNTNNPKAYLFEMFKSYGFTEWNDIVNLLDAETGKYVKSNTHRLIKHREFLVLANVCHSVRSKEPLYINTIKDSINTPIGKLVFKKVSLLGEYNANTIYVDKEKLKFPLKIRLCKRGDVFYPLGMKGKKKISKYLKDEKLSLVEKEHIWVLTSNEDIIWVIGKRSDERFKVTEGVKNILKIELK